MTNDPPTPAAPAGPEPPRGAAPVPPGLSYADLRRAVFLAAGLWLVYNFSEPLTTLILFFLLVFILAAVLNPLVVRMQRRGVPRMLSAVLLGMGILGFIGLLGWLALDPILTEVGRFVGSFDEMQQRLRGYHLELVSRYPQLASLIPDPSELFRALSPRLTALLGKLGQYTAGAAAALFSVVLLVVLVIYTVGQPTPLVTGLLAAVPAQLRRRTETALARILEQLKNWAFGSLILGLIVGVISGVGLALLGMPYALLFGVIAGVGEMIPNIGPVISAVPPILVALTINPLLALWVALLFVVIQQVENNLIVPRIMGQILNLHPVSVIFVVLVMGVLFGLLGAVLAVPVCAMLKVCWEEFYLHPQGIDSGSLTARAEEIVQSSAPAPAAAARAGSPPPVE